MPKLITKAFQNNLKDNGVRLSGKTATRPLGQKCLIGEQPVKSHLA